MKIRFVGVFLSGVEPKDEVEIGTTRDDANPLQNVIVRSVANFLPSFHHMLFSICCPQSLYCCLSQIMYSDRRWWPVYGSIGSNRLGCADQSAPVQPMQAYVTEKSSRRSSLWRTGMPVLDWFVLQSSPFNDLSLHSNKFRLLLHVLACRSSTRARLITGQELFWLDAYFWTSAWEIRLVMIGQIFQLLVFSPSYFGWTHLNCIISMLVNTT